MTRRPWKLVSGIRIKDILRLLRLEMISPFAFWPFVG